MNFTFPKSQHLKSKKLIGEIFEKGKKIHHYPLLVYYLPCESDAKIGVTVSKRNFKRAVDRNQIKRYLRESFRLNQHQLKAPSHMMIVYIGKEIQPFSKIEKSFLKVVDSINHV